MGAVNFMFIYDTAVFAGGSKAVSDGNETGITPSVSGDTRNYFRPV